MPFAGGSATTLIWNFFGLEQVASATLQPRLLFDIDLKDGPHLLKVKECLEPKPIGRKVLFVVGKKSRFQTIQAQALGVTDIVSLAAGNACSNGEAIWRVRSEPAR